MAYFHYRCGERITLLNDNFTALRSDSDFDNGLVITAEPLVNDVLFEIKIDRKVNSWSGSLEIGVVDCDPLHFDFPACASKIQNNSWILAGMSFFRTGNCILERYSTDLDKLGQDDRVGVMRTSEGDLIFYVNGESQGVAAENLPNTIYAIVDVYGKCVQVSVTSPALREHNNDDCLSGSSVLAIDNDILNVTLGGDLSELSMSSSNSLDIRMDMNVSLSLPEECPRPDKLRFHDRCGSLVKLSNGNRTAERRRPLDEFNNGVVMTHRPLRDSELFEIRIDRLVDKWSGSIEMGITTHNPSTLVFPATMTNMRSGTIMMSGCGILTNGKGTRREYGDFNLDELSEGDRVGMMRKPDGNLHYFINGLDQGVAAQRVPTTVWGVIDLYGMTIKVSIVERDEREEQNLMTRKNTRECPGTTPGVPIEIPPAYYDRLTFHPNCGTHAQVVNNGRTAHRPNAADDFNNGVVLTARPLKTGELFEVRLDRVVTKWAGSIEIGVTTHSPVELEFPFTMTNVRSGTWMMTGSGIMHNGTIVLEQYGVNLDRLQVGDRVGVVRKESGLLHFFVNGVDQGAAASNVPERIYGVIDLYGQAVEASIIDMYDYGSPDTMNSSLSNTTLYSDLRFHHVHGKNARIVNGGLTALRPRPFSEFNDAIVFSSRPLRDGELFEVCLDSVVDRWSGSIELGVTAVRPDDIDLPGTATDLCRDTWMLSGTSVMENGVTVKTNYPCDLDILTAGVRIGLVRSADKTLQFYKDGIPQGSACVVPNGNVYAVIDLYGRCAQVSIPCVSPMAGVQGASLENCARSDTSASLQATSVVQPLPPQATDLHLFSDLHGQGVKLIEGGRSVKRSSGIGGTLVYSAMPLVPDEPFEISITELAEHMAGSVAVGVSDTPPAQFGNLDDCLYITGNELRNNNKIVHHFTPSLHWLTLGDRISLLRTQDAALKIYVNGEELRLHFPQLPELTTPLYVVVDLRGQCCGVAITSHRAPPPSPLPDSLEDGGGAMVGVASSSVVNYEFCENHGRNVEVVEGRKSATRVASYNRGVTVIQPAFDVEGKVEVTVEQLDERWESSLIVGVVAGPPDRLHLPINALAFKSPCCIIAEDWVNLNGAKSRSNYGRRLADLKVGDKVGVVMTRTGFRLVVNDEEEEELIFSGGVGVHAVFDLYGRCKQIKIKSQNVADLEKADLECCEKERLTLPIASTSMTTSVVTAAPSSPLRNAICQFKEECVSVKDRLLLPERYFAMEGPTCFCPTCAKNDDKDNLLGWVRFPLPPPPNHATEKWHTAFYPTKMGAVRCILDTGQPLTKGQSQYGNLIVQKEDDVQVVFHPSLQNCKEGKGYKMQGGKVAHVAFQLLVKPGAYSVSRDEWSTKETGAIVLRALLVNVISG